MPTAPTEEHLNKPPRSGMAFNPILQPVLGGYPMANAPIAALPSWQSRKLSGHAALYPRYSRTVPASRPGHAERRELDAFTWRRVL